MSYRHPILIVPGEPNSVFFEIFFKSLKAIKIKNPLILITSIDLLKFHMKKMNVKKKIKLIEKNQLRRDKLDNLQGFGGEHGVYEWDENQKM